MSFKLKCVVGAFLAAAAMGACSGNTGTGGSLATPAGLAATPGNNQVALSWNAESNTTFKAYHLYWGLSAGALNQSVAVEAKTTQYTVSNLVNGTPYFFAVDAEDSGGTHTAKSSTVSATPVGPDADPPTLVSTVPATDATGVAISTKLVLTFSEAMDVGSLQLAVSPLITTDSGTWDDAHTTVTLTPTSTLGANINYTVTVVGKDAAGNSLVGNRAFSFTTVNPPDTTRPTVSITSPANGSSGVPQTSQIAVFFSEVMRTTETETAMSVNHGGTPVACTFTWDVNNRLLSCNPGSLLPSTNYSVVVGTGAEDLAGNSLASPYAFGFSTAATADTTPPTVVSSNPANNAIGVSQASTIQVTFSEPMNLLNTAKAFTASLMTGVSSAPITGMIGWNVDGTTLIFTPSAPFAYGANVTLKVSTSAQDLAGNGLNTAFSASFRVVRQGSQTLKALNANNGSVSSSGSVFDPEAHGGAAGYGWAGEIYNGTGQNKTDTYSRLFLSFDLSGLPADAGVTDATLYVYLVDSPGHPFDAFGSLYAQSVLYGPTLDGGDLDVAVLPSPCDGGSCPPEQVVLDKANPTKNTTQSASVGEKVSDDWVHASNRGGFSQFRIGFLGDSTPHTSSNYLIMDVYSGDVTDVNQPTLNVVYEYP